MQPNLEKAGRLYTTLSLAVLPVALVVMFTYLYGLEPQGPEVQQGLSTLATIVSLVLTFLGINTLAATLLSVFVAEVRPRKKPYLYALLAMVLLGGLIYRVIV